MNEDNSEPQPWIDPALEARLVAHVLGETSAFEAAELERLLAENPELALFKRRIEAVHSLATSAVKPDAPKLQLPADKRQKLLDIIGRAPTAEPSRRIFVMPNAPWWKSEALLRVAVCLVMIALVLGIFSTISLERPTGTANRFEGERGGFISNDEPNISLPQGTAVGQAQPSTSSSYRDQGFVVFRKGGDGAMLMGEKGSPATIPQSVTTPTTPTAFETVSQEKIAALANSSIGGFTMAPPAAAPQVSTTPNQVGAMSYMGGNSKDNVPLLGDIPAAGRVFRAAVDQPITAPVTRNSGESIAAKDEIATQLKRAEAITMSQANETVSWDSAYMYRGVNVMEQGQSSAPSADTAATVQLTPGSIVSTGVATPTIPNAINDQSERRNAQVATEGYLAATENDSVEKQKAASGVADMKTARDALAPAADLPDATAQVAARPVPASAAISANSLDALLAGVAGKDPAEAKEDSSKSSKASKFEGFVNYGSPITTVTTMAPAEEQKEEIQKLLIEANEFAESSRYDLAFKRYEQVLAVDHYNIAARRGLEKVNQAREKYAASAYNETPGSMAAQIANGWELPVRKFDIGRTTILSNPEIDRSGGTTSINHKLDEIVIPRIDFTDVTVRDALDFLKQRAAQLDRTEQESGKRGVNIVLNIPESAPEAGARINLGLTDIPLRAAIDYVAKAANLKLKVEPYAVSVVLPSTPTDVLITKEYKVPPGFITALPPSRSTGAPHLGTGGTTAAGSLPAVAVRSGAREFLENSGITFPPGATAYYIASSNKLIVKNTQANLDLVETVTAVPAPADPKPFAPGNEVSASKQPFSTFSLHVSDVSFQLARDALARGSRPEPDRIRTEEFYNAFDYNDPAPATDEEVTCRIESGAHPYLQQRDLVRLAVKVSAAGRTAGQPLRLTILLDTSGSMEREDRAESVRRALKSLVTLLGPQDRVTLIGFARTPRLLAEDVPGDQAGKLVEFAARTPSEGGTNLEEALSLASKIAIKSKLASAQNRIVLLTDGAANLGDANPERLARQIESTRQQGISFDACGVGAKGLNDSILEALTRKGDGRYYYLNSPEDADAGFARQLAGAFRPAAENVKVQVAFNPARVSRYRLLGFEQHLLKQQDFRNDKVQAAELSAEEAGVALYQIETLPEGSGEIGEVFVRFRDPAKGTMVERSWTMPYEAKVPTFDQASPSLQLATISALLAEKLRGDEQVDLDVLAPAIPNLRNSYSGQQRVAELIQMFETLRR